MRLHLEDKSKMVTAKKPASTQNESRLFADNEEENQLAVFNFSIFGNFNPDRYISLIFGKDIPVNDFLCLGPLQVDVCLHSQVQI